LHGEQFAGVQRQPLAVGSLDFVGNQQVGVQLGVQGAAGAVHERGRDQTGCLDLEHPCLAGASEAGVLFEKRDSRLNGLIMGGSDVSASAVISESPQQGHRLGG
jgi:hypothetical protein